MSGTAAGTTMLADTFEEQRPRLVGLAFRILGSQADAEDAVQEAWFRLARQDADTIDNLAGWLTTVVGRVCLDVLRSRRARPELSYDDRLPELVVTDPDAGPEDDALLTDAVGLALLIVLDTLRPAERLAFVLHDMFAVPFDEIATILDKSVDATKALASRARRKVHDSTPDRRRHDRQDVLAAFLAAARDGDFGELLRLLHPDVAWRSFSPQGSTVRIGATEVARAAVQGVRGHAVVQQVLVNGEPGLVVRMPDGRPMGIMACAVVDGRMAEVRAVRDPDRMARLHLPPLRGSRG